MATETVEQFLSAQAWNQHIALAIHEHDAEVMPVDPSLEDAEDEFDYMDLNH